MTDTFLGQTLSTLFLKDCYVEQVSGASTGELSPFADAIICGKFWMRTVNAWPGKSFAPYKQRMN
jgi:hypothetical protein